MSPFHGARFLLGKYDAIGVHVTAEELSILINLGDHLAAHYRGAHKISLRAIFHLHDPLSVAVITGFQRQSGCEFVTLPKNKTIEK